MVIIDKQVFDYQNYIAVFLHIFDHCEHDFHNLPLEFIKPHFMLLLCL